MSDQTPLALLPATELAQRLRARQISSVDLLNHHLARIDCLNPRINAVVVLDAERALQRARQADEALARGELWGPLHGLPMTVKESFDVPGLATTWGFEDQRNNIASQPAYTVERLQQTGAVIFGKTNVPVALADWQSFNPVYGTTHNPWDVTRTPGGSSGGSAAALAAGLTPLELGSDIGSSIRNPAHYCGVYGHKPTWGVLSMAGQELPGHECIDSVDMGVVGPMARSAHDLSLAMDILANPLRSFGTMGWQPATWRDNGTPASRLRVAIVVDDDQAEVDESVRSQLRKLAGFLRQRGLQVTDSERPVDSAESWDTGLTLLRSATGAMMSDGEYASARQQAAAWPPGSRDYPARHWHACTLSHRDWVHHDDVRARLRRQWDTFFTRWDVLICPVANTPAFTQNQHGPRWDRMLPVNGRPQPSTASLFWAVYPGVVGLPATVVPLGLSPEGLPVGAQIIGPAFADPVCLRLARWLEAEYRAFQPPPMALPG